ncbi:MAG TPA: hypothetical protein VFM94_11715 [Solirubrobacterales bacterium]|nr:hypothetical protein [Solirubrobacterales bacterium]
MSTYAHCSNLMGGWRGDGELRAEEPAILRKPFDVLAALDMRAIGEPLHASEMSYAMAAVIQQPADADDAWRLFDLYQRIGSHHARFDNPELIEFAEYAAYGSVVPFEHSPLGGDSLGNLLASGSGAGIGAGIGLMVAGGPTPLLFITVPAGMIICGSAKGVADGMAEGLRHHIRRLMGLPPEQ